MKYFKLQYESGTLYIIKAKDESSNYLWSLMSPKLKHEDELFTEKWVDSGNHTIKTLKTTIKSKSLGFDNGTLTEITEQEAFVEAL